MAAKIQLHGNIRQIVRFFYKQLRKVSVLMFVSFTIGSYIYLKEPFFTKILI